MNKNILFTGCAGFIGYHLINRLLTDGHTIVGIDNLSYGLIEQVSQKVEFHKADITDRIIFHDFLLQKLRNH